ncbi:glycoside hydrolase family 15 protein [Streptomyces hoynatensis]|uniref:Glycoside hydrolase family 15 protein n=1 Tax=Streptomyces hoynatensis TaxID=1141874 RepID=A0A3A9YSQ6_9ACTN|nr:glycoside hydrolase family 15 protein [Streptomyces hoynatensis]RKN39010.1 glycoside hydrolase family 15 protein [Streptomyces hoynatensis]
MVVERAEGEDGSGTRAPGFLRPRPWVLREYAVLGDGERGAVVGPEGEVVWLCAPRWHSDPVFSSLIGGAGAYVLRPESDWNVWGGHYEEGTLVHVGRWVTADSVVECREALAMPADPDRLVLLRQVRAVRGAARLRLRLDARAGFGAHGMRETRLEEGVWRAASGEVRLRLAGVPEARPGPEGELRALLTVPAGETLEVVLELSRREEGGRLYAPALWEATEREWRQAVPDCRDLPAPRDARQAYAVLRGLTSASGGMVAAATTSLPERANSGRTYDYRFAWVRDQCYAALGVAAHGPHPLFAGAVRFVAERVLADGDRLRPAYTVAGGPVAPERSLPLPGYPGGADRTGNQAADQFQLDAFGEVLQLFAAAAEHGLLDADARRAAEVAVAAVERLWRRPDAGIWELEERWWTHSRLAVVCGLRALARHVPGPAARRWKELAAAILAETRRRCLSTRGWWRRAEHDDGAESALLLPLARGCLAPGDPSGPLTRELVTRRLAQDGYLYRFERPGVPLGEAEGAFLMCGFAMALAARHDGDRTTAFRWFERTRAACGSPGLFTEEYDVTQRQLRGNLPQAFVHALLLESAAALRC